MRTLIYVPIVHSDVDLGSMADHVRDHFERVFGEQAWARRRDGVETMWAGLHHKLLALPLSWQRTRLYQDGLPVCGREADIVRDLAAQGSRNHQLLAELIKRGAILMGTEDLQLMMGEYGRVKKLQQAVLQEDPELEIEALSREGETLLRQRDAFMARRIDETLAEHETGILFLGLLHRVDELLAADQKFEIRHIIHNLPFAADPWRGLKERQA